MKSASCSLSYKTQWDITGHKQNARSISALQIKIRIKQSQACRLEEEKNKKKSKKKTLTDMEAPQQHARSLDEDKQTQMSH